MEKEVQKEWLSTSSRSVRLDTSCMYRVVEGIVKTNRNTNEMTTSWMCWQDGRSSTSDPTPENLTKSSSNPIRIYNVFLPRSTVHCQLYTPKLASHHFNYSTDVCRITFNITLFRINTKEVKEMVPWIRIIIIDMILHCFKDRNWASSLQLLYFLHVNCAMNKDESETWSIFSTFFRCKNVMG